MKPDKLAILRHSTAHLMAAAVSELFPGVKLGVGPVIEHGFYYDFQLERSLTPDDFELIENKMRELVKADVPFTREEIGIDEAIKLFTNLKQTFKVELLKDLKTRGTTKISSEEVQDVGDDIERVSVYQTGDFVDLCRGPHVASTKELKVFKLHKLASAYWRGQEENPQLQRVYGLAFASVKELKAHLAMLEEAIKRDHRKLGKELGLFVFSPLVGGGLPLYTPAGHVVRTEIMNYSRELQRSCYQEVTTQPLSKAELFKVSGHYDKFQNDMWRVKSNYSEEEYFLKPMNCPQHIQLFGSQLRSYKDLPLRLADFTQLHRDEKPGELSGLTRLRGFCQDDGHSFCREDQIAEEFSLVLAMIKEAMTTYGMDYRLQLSLWDPTVKEKYLGSADLWEKSQALMENLLREHRIEYTRVEGEAAFYGPKMDLMAKDSLGREWQLSTIQLDFNMPGRFGVTYVDQDGQEKTPVMIHRALVGSPDRFMGVLLEHYAGALPLWLSPTQVNIIPVSDEFNEYASSVVAELQQSGLRVSLDAAQETVGNKIRKSEQKKIPYSIVVGAREQEHQQLPLRRRGEKTAVAYEPRSLTAFLNEQIKTRR